MNQTDSFHINKQNGKPLSLITNPGGGLILNIPFGSEGWIYTDFITTKDVDELLLALRTYKKDSGKSSCN
jgi:hypothetical protein